MYKYDISIIIPVYNNEEYIDECINSILKQKYDINKIEVILIDDGSIDNSYKICEKYSKKYDNIILLKQKNSGVSQARNNGMKKASGKYILFLDSDDYLSHNTCRDIFNMFEKHYDEIDLITYPIVYNINNKLKEHPRYSKLFYKDSAVYDLTKDYNLVQATVNICIKNNFEKNELFHIKQNFSEDERFATKILMKKQKIGFCKEATYYYRRHVGTANDTITNPYYSFETITHYYEGLFKKYEKNGKIPPYIQSLYLNNLNWRIKQDALIPYHLEKKELDQALDRIKNLVSKIDTSVIMNGANMDFYHQVFLLDISNRNLEVDIKKNKIVLSSNNEFINEFEYIDGLISKLKLRNNKLYIMGSLLNPIFTSIDPELYIEKKYYDDTIKIEKLDTFVSNESYHLANFKTTISYAFDYSFDIQNIKSFKVYLKVDDKKLDIGFTFNKFSSNNFIAYNKNVLYSKKNLCFKIRNKNIVSIFKSRMRNFVNAFNKNKNAWFYRLLYYFTFKKNVWIYTDRGDSIDNAYTQFIHDIKKNDGIKKYYISKWNEKELNKYFTKEQKKYVVKQNSLKHKILYLHSKKIFTSFSDVQIYCPFNKSLSLYNDLTNYELIYLQHGILHANLIKMYAKEFTEIDKFVISTKFEEENLISKYHYKKEDLLYTGMPRMNNPLIGKEKNKILYAPSWRKYLIGDLVNNKRKLKEHEFIKSKFYQEMYGFLLSKELEELLEKNNYILEFKLHPIFKEYAKYFKINSKYIEMNFNKTNISEYKIFITDFSSFQFDFVKLRRPIIYFMPDMDEFKAGLHTYRELDLKYEDAFGKLCLKQDELIKELSRIIKNNTKVDKKYLNRMNNFFIDIKNPTEDIYNKIKNKGK